MPRYTTSQTYTEGNTQVVTLANTGALVPVAPDAAPAEVPAEDEDLEAKLRRITEQVPVRISNTSGSSVGSGSGDFHQYRQMRRREQTEFAIRREARVIEAEERTAKRRAKRLKKKEKKKQKKGGEQPASDETGKHEDNPVQQSDGNDSSSDSEKEC